MKKLILLLLLFVVSCQAQVINAFVDYLQNGYKMKLVGGVLYAYTDCDTISRSWNSFSQRDQNKMLTVYKAWQRSTKEFRRTMANITAVPVYDYTPPIPRIHLYFLVTRNKALLGAQTGVLGLDSTRIDLSRHNLAHTALVYETYIDLADTSIVINQFGLGNIAYPTWKYATLDSLRNFLNTSPAWTAPEN